MKPLAVIISLVVLNATLVFAQAETKPTDRLSEEQRAEIAQRIEEAIAALNLSEEQKDAFVAISEKYRAKMMEVRDSDDGRRKKFKQIRQIRADRDAEMKELLTAEQFATYQELQKQARDRAKEQREKM